MENSKKLSVKDGDKIDKGVIKCCTNCYNLNDKLWCEVFKMPPPKDFLNKPQECERWETIVPF
jgi:hypothetical protein